MGLVSLIVMEPGSEWPGHVGDSENIVTITDHEEGMLLRIRQRLALLRRQGEHVRVAVLACNDATDVASVARRTALAHELLSAVAAVGFGRLVLTAAVRASIHLRCELLSLAGTLSHTRGGGTTPTVSVRFSEATEGTQDSR